MAGIPRNHREMTKFKNAEESAYQNVRTTLKTWIASICGQQFISSSLHIYPVIGASTDSTSGKRKASTATTPLNPAEYTVTPGTPSLESTQVSLLSGVSTSSFAKISPAGKFVLHETHGPSPLFVIPSRMDRTETLYYQPREKELDKIKSTMFSDRPHDILSSNHHRTFIVSGIGGAGKTRLAFRFITEFKGEYDAVFFLIADSDARLSEQYSTLALRLNLVEPSDRDNEELCSEIFRAWLGDPVRIASESRPSKAFVKWLLVLDNAESTETIDKFWPAGRHGSILVTTRNPSLNPSNFPHSVAGRMQLKGLPTDEGARFLRNCAGDVEDQSPLVDANAQKIVNWVEGLPLAIHLLGKIMFDRGQSISQFLAKLPTRSDIVRTQNAKDPNLATAWALDTLQHEQKGSFKLLSLIAMFDPEKIEDPLLQIGPKTPDSDDSFATRDAYETDKSRLANMSLIDIQRNTGEVWVHRVVQEVTRDVLVRTGFAAPTFRNALDQLGAQWPFLNRNYTTGSATKVDRWEKCRLAYPHILHLLQVYEDFTARKVRGLASLQLAELLLEAAQ